MRYLLLTVCVLALWGCPALADTCTGSGAQEAELNLCLPTIGSNSWGLDMNNNMTTIGAQFSATTGHTHNGSSGEGPQISVANVAGAIAGPASSTDNGITRFNGTSGTSFQNSLVTLDDFGYMDFTGISSGNGIDCSTCTMGVRTYAPNDCSSQVSSGALCVDANSEALYFGDGSHAHVVLAGPGGATTDNQVVVWNGASGLTKDGAFNLDPTGVLSSTGDMDFEVDSDDNSSHIFDWREGSGTSVMTLAETGWLYVYGANPIISLLDTTSSAKDVVLSLDSDTLSLSIPTGGTIFTSTLSKASLKPGKILDMSALDPTDTDTGMKFPQGSSCTGATAEGQACWDDDANRLYVGDGATAITVGGLLDRYISFRGAWSPSGGCSRNDTDQINLASVRPTLTCSDLDSSLFYVGVLMPGSLGSAANSGYTGGAIKMRFDILSVNAAPTGNVLIECKAQCRGSGTVENGNYGSLVQTNLAVSTQYVHVIAESDPITPNGTCQPGVSISVVCNIDQGLTTAAMSDVRILDVGMQYPSYVSE